VAVACRSTKPWPWSLSQDQRRKTTRGRIQLETQFPPKRGDEFNLKNVSRQDERSNLCSESDQLSIGSD
jgi:hypothetical protein